MVPSSCNSTIRMTIISTNITEAQQIKIAKKETEKK